jgi:hypothetical protein
LSAHEGREGREPMERICDPRWTNTIVAFKSLIIRSLMRH